VISSFAVFDIDNPTRLTDLNEIPDPKLSPPTILNDFPAQAILYKEVETSGLTLERMNDLMLTQDPNELESSNDKL
jgi:hypothetical protein